MMRTGFHSDYWVIEWADGYDQNLADIIFCYPEIVRGRRVAIASWDSGSYEPTQLEYAKGWRKKHEIAISPAVIKVEDLPMPGFDEWYVYSDDVPEDHHNSFVNQWGFAPLDESNPSTLEFWQQVDMLRPLHVVCAGTTMFFVTQDEALYRKISAIQSKPTPP
jgi:hypothetical protein